MTIYVHGKASLCTSPPPSPQLFQNVVFSMDNILCGLYTFYYWVEIKIENKIGLFIILKYTPAHYFETLYGKNLLTHCHLLQLINLSTHMIASAC